MSSTSAVDARSAPVCPAEVPCRGGQVPVVGVLLAGLRSEAAIRSLSVGNMGQVVDRSVKLGTGTVPDR